MKDVYPHVKYVESKAYGSWPGNSNMTVMHLICAMVDGH